MIDLHGDGAESYERRWDASIELELERQNGLNWCWAAVAKGIVDHYGGPKQKQCQYATTFLQQKKSCCHARKPPLRCDGSFDVDSVLAHYGVYAAPPFRRPVSLATLRKELERDRPVVALVQFRTSAHALAITAVDVRTQRIGVSDPWFGPAGVELDIETFQRAYRGNGRWFYTILTRPPASAVQRTKVSLLHDRMPHGERETLDMPRPSSQPLEIDLYEADPYRLADGTGLQTAERFLRETVRLDVFSDRDGALWLDRALTEVRDEIEARLDRGFEARVVRCFAYKLEALWFTNPADTSHRTDHYIPVSPVPYYLEEGREYSTAELSKILVKMAEIVLPSIEINRKWIERLDRETALQPDDPTI